MFSSINKILKINIFIICLSILIGCKNSENEASYTYFESYEKITDISTEELEARFGNDAAVSSLIAYDVSAYKVTYNTTNYDGSEVLASGLVLIPDTQQNLKICSFQHSTLAKDPDPAIDQEDRAPSYLSEENAEIYLSAVLYASNGYLVSSADYIGYGSSGDLFHPYEHAETTATTCYDMINSTKELAELLDFSVSNNLYLLGYSQGGNSTMALHKYLEEEKAGEFNIERSAMGAGAYHKTAVGEYIFNFDGDLGFPLSLYLWVMDSYDKVYLQRGLSYYLKEPFAEGVKNNGYYWIVDQNTNPQEIFTDEFLAEVTNENSAFYAALEDNNVHNWQAENQIKLYHAENDELVPYFNSVNARNEMEAAGSTEILFEKLLVDPEAESIHGAGGQAFFTDVLISYFKFGL